MVGDGVNDVTIPRRLFDEIARYMMPRLAYDNEAQGLYNGMVIVAFGNQPTPEEPSVDAPEE